MNGDTALRTLIQNAPLTDPTNRSARAPSAARHSDMVQNRSSARHFAVWSVSSASYSSDPTTSVQAGSAFSSHLTE